MQLFIPEKLIELLKEHYIFVDNDFLSYLFDDEKLFEDFFKIYPLGFVEIDPITKFEFLRDMFVLKERKPREEFLSLEVFVEVSNHQEIFSKIHGNALILSKIYAKNKHKPGTIDLFLAGRLMIFPSNHLLITGNKKHYPDCIWDLVTSFSYYNNEKYHNFSVLRFNRKKFDQEYSAIEQLEL